MVDAPDREMTLVHCEINSSAGDLFLECLARNRGPTILIDCQIEPGVLANALRGSIRLKVLALDLDPDSEDFQTIIDALANNSSLEKLYIDGIAINDTGVSPLCGALAGHPSLRVLLLGAYTNDESLLDWDAEYRLHALATLVWSNNVLQEIQVTLDGHCTVLYNRHSFEALVVPPLEALTIAHITVRPKLLGRAIAMARFNPSLSFKFLLENMDVVATRSQHPWAVPWPNQYSITIAATVVAKHHERLLLVDGAD